MSNSAPRQDSRKPTPNRPRTDSSSSNPAAQASPKIPNMNTGPALPRANDVAPVNGFNRAEVVDFLQQGYTSAEDALRDPAVPSNEKPELYKNTEVAWGNKGGLPSSMWGQKSGLMATGADFLMELRKQLQRSPGAHTSSTPSTPTPGTPTSISPGGGGRQG